MEELLKKLIEDYRNGKYKMSPFSRSYYFFEDYDRCNYVGWGSKANKSIRISDHWNFYSQGDTHCKILSRINEMDIQGWKICIYDTDFEAYTVICEDEKIILELLDKFDEIFEEKEELKRIEREKQEAIEKIESEKRAKEYQKRYKKELRERKKRLIKRINKDKNLKKQLKELINLERFHITAYGSRRYKETDEYKIYKKFWILLPNVTTTNDAPRGGRIGDIYILNKKDIRKIKKEFDL